MGSVRRLRLAASLASAGLATLGFAAVALAGPAAPTDVRTGFLAHRAVYDMTLDARSERSEVAAAGGRLVYEFSGSTCDGFASRFRLVTNLTLADGATRTTDLRTASHEDGAGKTFDFLNENWVDGLKIEQVQGAARRDGDDVRVRLSQPAAKEATLPGRLRFPTEHLAAILDAARDGKSFAEIDLYDGSETGEKTYHTTVVVGREQTGPEDAAEEPAAASEMLAGHRRWPVDVSFFEPKADATGEETPVYQLSFLLYDNGVSRRMRLDYGAFSLKGSLSSLTALPAAPACP